MPVAVNRHRLQGGRGGGCICNDAHTPRGMRGRINSALECVYAVLHEVLVEVASLKRGSDNVVDNATRE